MQKTEHYALSQYEPADRVTREAVNADNAAIDAAIAAVAAAGGGAELVMGQYAGTGDGMSHPQNIELGFQPKAVIVFSAVKDFAAMALPSWPQYETGSNLALYITANGFNVSYSLNQAYAISQLRYHYIAVKSTG